jgi:oligopeptidase A
VAENPLHPLASPLPFDRVSAEHVEPAVDALLVEARARLDAIAAGSAKDPLGAFDVATLALDDAMAVVSHLESVATYPAWRAAYNAVQPKLSAFYSSILLDARLYGELKRHAASPAGEALAGSHRRFLTKTLDEFRRNGAELDPAGKEKLEAIAVELATTTTRYAQNVLDSTNAFELLVDGEARLAGLPETALRGARESAKAKGKPGFRFTLQAPSYLAVMTYLDDASIREAVWRAYSARATSAEHDNRVLVADILRLRRAKAALLGFRDFADLTLEDRMAKTGRAAYDFVRDLEARTRPFFERENAELLAFRRSVEGEGAPALAPWDVAYWAEKQRRALYDFDEEELRPYFSADRVLSGLFEIATRLYGVRVVPRAGLPTWHADVRTFEVREADGRLAGLFYVDLFPRESKRDGAWMAGLHTATRPDEPHLGLMCANLSPPGEGRPALLTHREVETLFHEFGHLLHHLLSRVPVRALAGTSVAWDFVELPSQIMENWCWERASLDLFARHHETGAPIPDALLAKMRRARTYRAANAMMRQLGFASVDLAMHTEYEPARDGDVIAYARGVLARFSAAPLPADYAMVAAFGHLFASSTGYAAGYYSYKWAEVLDADAFTRFLREGLLSGDVGRAFRDEVLARGDSEEPSILFERFMGRPPRLDALLERSGLTAHASDRAPSR